MKTNYPSYCCQKCGELIGWIGRVMPFHKCKEKNMNPLPKYNEKGELDKRLTIDPVTGYVGIGTPQRTWVGLTEQEIERTYMDTINFQENARILEDILKEKNI